MEKSGGRALWQRTQQAERPWMEKQPGLFREQQEGQRVWNRVNGGENDR